MISLSHLNKLTFFAIFFTLLTFTFVLAEEEPADIWEEEENKNEQNDQTNIEQDITIESPILSDDVSKVIIKIDENKIEDHDRSIVGIFDPEKNNFNLNMWLETDGEDNPLNSVKEKIDYFFNRFNSEYGFMF